MSEPPSTSSPADYLLPVDEDWFALLQRLEEPLLIDLCAPPSPGYQPWRLPPLFSSGRAREAWWRIYQAVRDGFDRARRRRLLAPDGKFELAPLLALELDPADVETLSGAARECSRALAGLGEDELAPALSQIAENWDAGGDRQRDTSVQGLVADLLRVAQGLWLAGHLDPDGQLLLELVRGQHGDLVLTAGQERAYAKFVRRFLTAQGDDDETLRLWAMGVR